MSLWRVDGDPADDAGLSAAEVSTRKGGPLDYAALCGSLGPTGACAFNAQRCARPLRPQLP
jgi:hypothetical protein